MNWRHFLFFFFGTWNGCTHPLVFSSSSWSTFRQSNPNHDSIEREINSMRPPFRCDSLVAGNKHRDTENSTWTARFLCTARVCDFVHFTALYWSNCTIYETRSIAVSFTVKVHTLWLRERHSFTFFVVVTLQVVLLFLLFDATLSMERRLARNGFRHSSLGYPELKKTNRGAFSNSKVTMMDVVHGSEMESVGR